MCRDLLQKDQSLVDIWLIVANLYAENDEIDATIQVSILNPGVLKIICHTFINSTLISSKCILTIN